MMFPSRWLLKVLLWILWPWIPCLSERIFALDESEGCHRSGNNEFVLIIFGWNCSRLVLFIKIPICLCFCFLHGRLSFYNIIFFPAAIFLYTAGLLKMFLWAVVSIGCLTRQINCVLKYHLLISRNNKYVVQSRCNTFTMFTFIRIDSESVLLLI